MPKIFSDHAPMLTNISLTSSHQHKIFRYENYLLKHANVTHSIRIALNFSPHSNPMHALYHIFARVRSSIISNKQLSLGALDKEINFVESQI